MLTRRTFKTRQDEQAWPGAHDADRTRDLVLTKDVLCQLSYVGPLDFVSRRPLFVKRIPLPPETLCALRLLWSGRWDLNPRQPAWKAGTLPLSYARLFPYSPECSTLSRTSDTVTTQNSALTTARFTITPDTHTSLPSTHPKISTNCMPTLHNTCNQLSAAWWAGKDSNLGRHKPADLQSAPFGHLGTCPQCFIDRFTPNSVARITTRSTKTHRPIRAQTSSSILNTD